MRSKNLLIGVVFPLVALACGGGGGDGYGGGGGVTTPPPAPVVTTVNVTLSANSFEVGETATATAAVLDQNGAAMTGKTVTWTSDNQSVATVTSAGVVTGVATGTANITAAVEGKQGQAQSTIVKSTKWVLDATILNNASAGASGSIANTSALRLKDGRYRLFLPFVPGSPGGMSSMISTDGVNFTKESGIRLEIPVQLPGNVFASFGMPGIVRMDDGRARMFMNLISSSNGSVKSGIYSFTSSDEGLTWTMDSGMRVDMADTGLSYMTCCGIVKMKTGGWRMYFSDALTSVNPQTGFVTLLDPKIKSAFSSDLTTWTVDTGIRIGPGATGVTGNGAHPGAIANDDGSITLVYFRQIANNLSITMYATSADGLSFTTERKTNFGVAEGLLIAAGDPSLMRLDNGDVRMFFNWGDDKSGTVYTAHRPPFTLTGK
jgi:hypothetical protein